MESWFCVLVRHDIGIVKEQFQAARLDDDVDRGNESAWRVRTDLHEGGDVIVQQHVLMALVRLEVAGEKGREQVLVSHTRVV